VSAVPAVTVAMKSVYCLKTPTTLTAVPAIILAATKTKTTLCHWKESNSENTNSLSGNSDTIVLVILKSHILNWIALLTVVKFKRFSTSFLNF